MKKHVNKGNEGTDSFQFGRLPGCDTANVEVVQFCWATAGHTSRVVHDRCETAESEHVWREREKKNFSYQYLDVL